MLELYKRLKDSGYPQGGQGMFIVSPDSGERYYMPLPSELYAQLALSPKDWQKVSDALAGIYIEHYGIQ